MGSEGCGVGFFNLPMKRGDHPIKHTYGGARFFVYKVNTVQEGDAGIERQHEKRNHGNIVRAYLSPRITPIFSATGGKYEDNSSGNQDKNKDVCG
jgi:hypothetical protein